MTFPLKGPTEFGRPTVLPLTLEVEWAERARLERAGGQRGQRGRAQAGGVGGRHAEAVVRVLELAH